MGAMHALPLGPELLHARDVVHALVIADVVFPLAILAWAGLREDLLLLLPGVPIACLFLVVDVGAWDLDQDDLGKRRRLGFLALLAAAAIAIHAINQRIYPGDPDLRTDWVVFALVLAGLSLFAIILCTWARGVMRRCTRERMGGGGGLDVDSSCKPPEGGGTSGWVGRRRT